MSERETRAAGGLQAPGPAAGNGPAGETAPAPVFAPASGEQPGPAPGGLWPERYDVVMPVLKRDWPAAERGLPYVLQNLPLRRLVVLSAPDILPLLPKDERIVLVDENTLWPGLTLAAVKEAIYRRIYTDKRAGWYFQQFLKLAYARICEGPAYISWDADTIPLRPIPYQNAAGQYLFTLKEELHAPYFDTIRALFGLEKQCPESFIAENMIFDTALVRGMLAEIEANETLEGGPFWERIINAIAREQLAGSAFSEFETFGSYVTARHPGRYATRRLATLRSGKNILGKTPSPAMLAWAGESYDTLSIEKFNASTPLVLLAKSPAYRAKHTAAALEAHKQRYRVIPAVYGWGRSLWPRFKAWGGKYKRMLRKRRG